MLRDVEGHPWGTGEYPSGPFSGWNLDHGYQGESTCYVTNNYEIIQHSIFFHGASLTIAQCWEAASRTKAATAWTLYDSLDPWSNINGISGIPKPQFSCSKASHQALASLLWVPSHLSSSRSGQWSLENLEGSEQVAWAVVVYCLPAWLRAWCCARAPCGLAVPSPSDPMPPSIAAFPTDGTPLGQP